MPDIKKPRGIRRDRHCHRCRAQNIKCDLNRPRCQSCQQSDQPCQYPRRVIWMGEKKTTLQEGSTSPTPSPQGSIEPSPEACVSHKGTSINVYGFVDLLSDFYQEIQSSQRDLPDEAIQLIPRILSFARSRLRGENNGAIQSHVVALTNLSKVIESLHPVALFGIATFAMFEVCCGSFGAWHCHLHGARSLLDLHCRDKADMDSLVSQIPGLADVLAYLVWFDVTGALVQERDLIFDYWHRGILSPAFFDSVGCPADTFELYAQLVTRGLKSVLELSSLAMDQVLRLGAGDSTDRGLATVVYRCAGAMVAFSRAGDGNDEDRISTIHSNTITSMVDRVCGAISAIPTTSRFYVHMATPIYLTGMHATTSRQCDILRQYWRNCRQCEFPRYPDAQEQSECRWRKRLICGG